MWYDKQDLLPPRILDQIRKPESRVVVSVVTIWELSIKRSLGKLPGTGSFSQMIQRSGFETLTVQAEHAEAVEHLPHLHGDPFDRLLIAQAMHEGLTLVTHDRALALYGVPVLLV